MPQVSQVAIGDRDGGSPMSTNEPPQPEYLGPVVESAGSPTDLSEGPSQPRGRRTAAVTAGMVAVVAAMGAGAYGFAQLMPGGSSPATAVPASAIGYVSLDLDPSAGQKIEAIKMMRAFPGLRKELDISSEADLRRTVFEEALDGQPDCSATYARDVEPWVGKRVALAAVPRSGKVEPLIVLQVTDQDKARAGVRTLDRCQTGDKPTGVAFVGDYMLLTEGLAGATAMAESAEAAPLAEDATFTTWMERAGAPGIVTMYGAPAAGATLAEMGREAAGGLSASGAPDRRLETAVKDFEGAVGVVRFEDGAVEAEFSSKGLGSAVAGADVTAPDIRTLPDTTAVALSVSLADGWVEALASDEVGLQAMMGEVERETGLRLPDDLETLLGSGFDVSMDASADFEELAGAAGPVTFPFGMRIKGDPATITPVLDKLTADVPPDMLTVRQSDDLVAVGFSPDHVASLLTEGDLGDNAALGRAVPDVDRSTGTVFVDFDADGGWLERHLKSFGNQEAARNVAPLEAFGVGGWRDGDGVQHTRFRLTTD